MTRRKGKGRTNEKVQAGTGPTAGEAADKAPIGDPQDAAGSGAGVAVADPTPPELGAGNAPDGAGAGDLGPAGETVAVAGAAAPGGEDDEGLADGKGDESGVAPGQEPEAAAGGNGAGAGDTAIKNDGDGSADGAGSGDADEITGAFGDGAQISGVTLLRDGSGFFTASFPLPKDHWIYSKPGDGYLVPPMPLRMGGDNPARAIMTDHVRAAGKYAVKAATINGTEVDFDPDAMLQNLVVGMLGYHTPDGLSEDAWCNPNPVPAPFAAGFAAEPGQEVPETANDGTAQPTLGEPVDQSDLVDEPLDLAVMAAEQAAYLVLDQLLELYELPEAKRLQLLFSSNDYDVPNAISALTRKIGRDRAMPHVVLQELVLRKHREDVPPTRAELMLARVFTTVLVELDQFEKDWAAEQEAAKPKPDPVPVPLEETTLEGVDGPMDTI